MAELLHTAPPTYASWERNRVNLRRQTAERVGRFYSFAMIELQLLDQYGLSDGRLVPFHVVATLLGLPQEQLLRRYREQEFEAIDAGILGLWVPIETIQKLRRR
jgi:hypothetical protein